jgi:DNA polymerase III epsilon subunit-like protein
MTGSTADRPPQPVRVARAVLDRMPNPVSRRVLRTRDALRLRVGARARRARVAWALPAGDRRTRQWPEAAVASRRGPARTAPPPAPEYHGDTLAHWRFGWDLADRTRAHGFETDVLVTRELADAVAEGRSFPYDGKDFDVDDLMGGASGIGLTVVAGPGESERHGFLPPFQFTTLHLRRPA